VRGAGPIIETLNLYLSNELSAVEIYALALKHVEKLGLPGLLEECRRSHLQRVEILRKHILELGGEPTAAPGAWGAIAQAVEIGLRQVHEKVGITALEEFEYQDLQRYREELIKLDDQARRLMRTHVLPAQERTYRTIKTIRHTLG
jgi:bacterioferritin (cytochrome b1)